MSGVFQQNLTSDLMFEALCKIALHEDSKFLDLGCGDGNIGIRIGHHAGLSKIYGSDVSSLAIDMAKENAKNEGFTYDYRVGSMLSPWADETFDVISCDVAAISSFIAEKSDWYQGVSCLTGEDGLALVRPIIEDIDGYLKHDGILIIPQISLANKESLRIYLGNKFNVVEEVLSREWPVPRDLIDSILESGKGLSNENWEIQEKFGLYTATTAVLVCGGVKINDRK